MAFTNYGLLQFGSWIRGESPIAPTHLAFGHSGSSFDPANPYLGNEFLRKEVTWSTFNNRPRFTVSLSTTEANGSYFGELGLGSSDNNGSKLFFRSLTAVGSKNNTFDVDYSGDILIRRG